MRPSTSTAVRPTTQIGIFDIPGLWYSVLVCFSMYGDTNHAAHATNGNTTDYSGPTATVARSDERIPVTQLEFSDVYSEPDAEAIYSAKYTFGSTASDGKAKIGWLMPLDNPASFVRHIRHHRLADYPLVDLEVPIKYELRDDSNCKGTLKLTFDLRPDLRSNGSISTVASILPNQSTVELATIGRTYESLFLGMLRVEGQGLGPVIGSCNDYSTSYFGLYVRLLSGMIALSVGQGPAWPDLALGGARYGKVVCDNASDPAPGTYISGVLRQNAGENGSRAFLLPARNTHYNDRLTGEIIYALVLIMQHHCGFADLAGLSGPCCLVNEYASGPSPIFWGIPQTALMAPAHDNLEFGDLWAAMRFVLVATDSAADLQLAIEFVAGRLWMLGPEHTHLTTMPWERFEISMEMQRCLQLFVELSHRFWVRFEARPNMPDHSAASRQCGVEERELVNSRVTSILGREWAPENMRWATKASMLATQLGRYSKRIGSYGNFDTWDNESLMQLSRALYGAPELTDVFFVESVVFAMEAAQIRELTYREMKHQWSLPCDGCVGQWTMDICGGYGAIKRGLVGTVGQPHHAGIPNAVLSIPRFDDFVPLMLFYGALRRSVTDTLIHSRSASDAVVGISVGRPPLANARLAVIVGEGRGCTGASLYNTFWRLSCNHASLWLGWGVNDLPAVLTACSVYLKVAMERNVHVMAVVMPTTIRQVLVNVPCNPGGSYVLAEKNSHRLTSAHTPVWTHYSCDRLAPLDLVGFVTMMASHRGVHLTWKQRVVGVDTAALNEILVEDVIYTQMRGSRPSEMVVGCRIVMIPAIMWLGSAFTEHLMVHEVAFRELAVKVRHVAGGWLPHDLALDAVPCTFLDGAAPAAPPTGFLDAYLQVLPITRPVGLVPVVNVAPGDVAYVCNTIISNQTKHSRWTGYNLGAVYYFGCGRDHVIDFVGMHGGEAMMRMGLRPEAGLTKQQLAAVAAEQAIAVTPSVASRLAPIPTRDPGTGVTYAPDSSRKHGAPLADDPSGVAKSGRMGESDAEVSPNDSSLVAAPGETMLQPQH